MRVCACHFYCICDFLLQAFAEELHERVRKELWGYCNDESLSAEDLHKIQYQVYQLALGCL